MKRIIIIIIIIMLTITLVLCSIAIAEDQPKLLNHQFYGKVTWAKDSPVPSLLTAALDAETFASEIRSSPCLEDVCEGRYGYDSDNIIRVQGDSGEIIFSIDGVEVGKYQYQEDTVTKLDFDLRPEAENTQSSGGSSRSGSSQQPVNETDEKSSPLPEVTEEVKKNEPMKTPPKNIPTFQTPTSPAKKAEEGGINFYLIGGIALIIVAIAVVTFLIIKKRREAEES